MKTFKLTVVIIFTLALFSADSFAAIQNYVQVLKSNNGMTTVWDDGWTASNTSVTIFVGTAAEVYDDEGNEVTINSFAKAILNGTQRTSESDYPAGPDIDDDEYTESIGSSSVHYYLTATVDIYIEGGFAFVNGEAYADVQW